MRVLGLCGSLRNGSYNRMLLAAAEGYASAAGASVDRLDLKTLALPVYDCDIETAGLPAQVGELKRAIEACDVLLIASPEYNHSIPAPLKNAIDWASRQGNSFKGKVAAVCGASTGRFGTVRGQAHLRLCLAAVNVLVPTTPEVFISFAEEAFTPGGDLKSERSKELLKKLVDNALAIARELAP